jgi:dCTP deaminase
MILTDPAILEALANGSIVLEPFSLEYLGPNSYNVHLGKSLATYRERVIDAKSAQRN